MLFSTVHEDKQRIKTGRPRKQEFVVERSVQIKYDQFIYLSNHLLEPCSHIANHINDMFIDDNGLWHVMMVCCLRADRLMFVMSKRKDFAYYVSFIENKGEKVELRGKRKCRKFCVKNDILLVGFDTKKSSYFKKGRKKSTTN